MKCADYKVELWRRVVRHHNPQRWIITELYEGASKIILRIAWTHLQRMTTEQMNTNESMGYTYAVYWNWATFGFIRSYDIYVYIVTCRVVRVTKWRVLVRMIRFTSTSVTHSLLITRKYRKYSAIADLPTFQFTVSHALGFSIFTSRLLATDLNTEL
jgi:hypothetical protein